MESSSEQAQIAATAIAAIAAIAATAIAATASLSSEICFFAFPEKQQALESAKQDFPNCFHRFGVSRAWIHSFLEKRTNMAAKQ